MIPTIPKSTRRRFRIRRRVRRPHVFLHSSRRLAQHPALRRAGFDYLTTLRGSSQNFNVYYDPSLGTDGENIADGVLQTCESDYTTLSEYFGNITPGGIPFNIIIAALEPNKDGSGGAYHYSCAAVDLYEDVLINPSLDVDRTRMLVVAEEVEVFSDSQGAGWDCGASNGEGLSRVLATELYPNELNGYATAAAWLDSDRPNWVDNNNPTDSDPLSNGCSTLFLNWLHYQLGYGWDEIVAAGASTLGQTYTSLSQYFDGWTQFKSLMDTSFPQGTPSGVTNDNPFPLPSPSPSPTPPTPFGARARPRVFKRT